jgi:hypothetical protein
MAERRKPATAPSAAKESEKETPSKLARWVAVATIASALAALTNAYVAWQQHSLAVLQYTPEVAIGITDWQSGSNSMEYRVLIRNVGQITIFKANITTGMIIISDPSRTGDVFQALKPPDKDVAIGPGDSEYIHGGDPLTPASAATIAAGGMAVAGAKISFTDGLGRKHERYVCETAVFANGAVRRGYCESPKQF